MVAKDNQPDVRQDIAAVLAVPLHLSAPLRSPSLYCDCSTGGWLVEWPGVVQW